MLLLQLLLCHLELPLEGIPQIGLLRRRDAKDGSPQPCGIGPNIGGGDGIEQERDQRHLRRPGQGPKVEGKAHAGAVDRFVRYGIEQRGLPGHSARLTDGTGRSTARSASTALSSQQLHDRIIVQ